MRAFDAAGKNFCTYSWPSASPIELLTSCTPLFQRWRCCCWPESVLLKNSNRASSNGLLRYDAFIVMTCAAIHAFHVASGVFGTIAAKLLKNDGWLITHSLALSMP